MALEGFGDGLTSAFTRRAGTFFAFGDPYAGPEGMTGDLGPGGGKQAPIGLDADDTIAAFRENGAILTGESPADPAADLSMAPQVLPVQPAVAKGPEIPMDAMSTLAAMVIARDESTAKGPVQSPEQQAVTDALTIKPGEEFKKNDGTVIADAQKRVDINQDQIAAVDEAIQAQAGVEGPAASGPQPSGKPAGGDNRMTSFLAQEAAGAAAVATIGQFSPQLATVVGAGLMAAQISPSAPQLFVQANPDFGGGNSKRVRIAGRHGEETGPARQSVSLAEQQRLAAMGPAGGAAAAGYASAGDGPAVDRDILGMKVPTTALSLQSPDYNGLKFGGPEVSPVMASLLKTKQQLDGVRDSAKRYVVGGVSLKSAVADGGTQVSADRQVQAVEQLDPEIRELALNTPAVAQRTVTPQLRL